MTRTIEAGSGKHFRHRLGGHFLGPKRKGFHSLHDDWTALIFGLCGLAPFLHFALYFLNRLLNFLEGAPLTRPTHIGYFLFNVTFVFGQLVSQADKLKHDDPADCSQKRKCKNYDNDNRRKSFKGDPFQRIGNRT